jgi:hypothetical protein
MSSKGIDNPATKKKGKAAAAMRDPDLEGSPATEPRIKSSNSAVVTPQEGQQLQGQQLSLTFRSVKEMIGSIISTCYRLQPWCMPTSICRRVPAFAQH